MRTKLTAFCIPLVFGAYTAHAQVRIAVASALTGQFAPVGQQLRVGAELAVEELNRRGGVLGQRVQLEVADDGCDPRQGVSVANYLAAHRVSFVVGHLCSGSTIAASRTYAEENILLIAPGASSPAYTDQGLWNTFRVCGRDDQQGAAAGKFVAERYGKTRIAVLDDGSSYGKGLAEEMLRALTGAGVHEALRAAYVPGERDYAALISRLKAANIEVVYVGGYYTEAALIARQSRDQGLRMLMIGGDGLNSSQFWSIAGDAGDGTILTFPRDARNSPEAAEVVRALKAHGSDADGFTLYAYAAVQVWAEGVEGAGKIDPAAVAATLKSDGRSWRSVLGPIRFDVKGDVVGASYAFLNLAERQPDRDSKSLMDVGNGPRLTWVSGQHCITWAPGRGGNLVIGTSSLTGVDPTSVLQAAR